jgi:serine/threonine-protein kinase RsbW/sigma-B regulation protein RsbU (phosphoserine phosphatase)
MIPIDLAHMEQSLLLVEQNLESFVSNLDPEQHYKATFICEEILTNFARHANFENRTPNVSFKLDTLEQEALLLTFRDNAQPFDLLEYPDPKIGGDLEEAELGGLGIYLTKQYAKNIQYCYENEFNILKIIL